MLISVTNLTGKRISLPGPLGAVDGGKSVSADVLQSQLEKMSELETLKAKGYINYTVGLSPAVPDMMETKTLSQLPIFVSTEQTGTGAVQNIAHGLSVVPAKVLVIPTDLTPVTVGQYSAVQGAHTATNCLVTVTTGKKYVVVAFA